MARKTKADAEQTRQKILTAALDLFVTKGYERATFEDVARRIRLTKGAVYWHFKSKPDLLTELIVQMSAMQTELVGRALLAVAQYQKSIQSAFREVADALAARGTVGQQVSAQESLVHAVAETYRLSSSRYDKGIDSYLSVLDAQRSLYGAQQGLVALRLAKLANQVQLYAVLGGGWQDEKQTIR